MFQNLLEVIKTYSFQSVLKGNVLSTTGSFGGSSINGLSGSKSNSPASNMVSNRFLSTYYSKMQEINDYELNSLTITAMNIYMDFIRNYFTKEGELIIVKESVNNHSLIQKDINKIFTDLDIVGEVKDHLWDILYHGSFCFKKAFDPESRSYVKFYLQNPHNVVTVKKDKGILCHLVTSRDGTIYQVRADSIFRLGKADLNLVNDINTEFFSKVKEDTLVRDDFMVAGTPLYYCICNKVKEFLLKEQILSLLSIKDLIQPLLLLVRMDKNTSPDEGNRLALNIENSINKYSDISSIISSNFSINSLIDSLMNNIRVIPDYHSSMGDMNNIDLSKITNKIQDIENSQENRKDSILTDCSIPRSLFNGETTKWDAIKQSQRLNSKINGFILGISDSIKLEAINIIEETKHIRLKPEDIIVNLFTKTDVDYNVEITNIEIVSQISEGVQRVLTSCSQTLQDIKFIDPSEYAKYILSKLKSIDTDITKFMNESTIKKYLVKLKQAEEAQAAQDQQQ